MFTIIFLFYLCVQHLYLLAIPTRRSSDLVPRFFVPEHGTMFTLALVRFPPTATKEIQYLNAKGEKRTSARVNIVPCSRAEERFSRNAETEIVWRLLIEKKKHNEKIVPQTS